MMYPQGSRGTDKASSSVSFAGRMKFPPGYRFQPTDAELIHYLKEKITKKSTSSNIIHQVSLYDYSPWELTERCPRNASLQENEWYFFTPRNRKYLRGRRPDRKAADGYWVAATSEKPVIHEEHTIGYKSKLDYYLGDRKDRKRTDWKMTEYKIRRTGSAPSGNANGEMNKQLDEWVLCKIYLNPRRKKHEGDLVNENADWVQDWVQDMLVDEATLQNQNSSDLVCTLPPASTAAYRDTFTGLMNHQPACDLQFQQNNFFDERWSAGFSTSNMLGDVVHFEPNYPILASSNLSNPSMHLEPITGDSDDVDLSDMIKHVVDP